MADLRVASVGAGYFGRFQLNAWARMEGVALAGILDTDAGRRAELRDAYPDVEICGALSELLALGVDLLDIATPPATHASLIRAALGKVPTIVCQKPFSTSLEEARSLVDKAAATGTKLIVHENFRFQPWYRAMRQVLVEGRLGDVLQARFALRPGDGQGPEAYLARQPYFQHMPRFLIHETGIHFVDLFRFLFGEPDALSADLRRCNPAIVGEDAGGFTFHIGPQRAQFDANRLLDHAAANTRLTMGEFEVEGTKATLRLSGDGRITVRAHGSLDETPQDCPFNDTDFGGDCVFAFQAHVRDHLLHGAPLETEARSYLRNMELEELIYRAAAEGRRLKCGRET
jgi:D-apiose dehydrogenase